MEERRGLHRDLVGKLEGKSPLGRTRINGRVIVMNV